MAEELLVAALSGDAGGGEYRVRVFETAKDSLGSNRGAPVERHEVLARAGEALQPVHPVGDARSGVVTIVEVVVPGGPGAPVARHDGVVRV